MTPYETHKEAMALRDQLVKVLGKETKTKPRDYNRELFMIGAETGTWARKHPAACSVTLQELERCDTMAVGHIDWWSKLCLYVAETAYGLRPKP